MRACAAAAEVAVAVANARAAGGSEVDPQAAVASGKMKVVKLTQEGWEKEGGCCGNGVLQKVLKCTIYRRTIEQYRQVVTIEVPFFIQHEFCVCWIYLLDSSTLDVCLCSLARIQSMYLNTHERIQYRCVCENFPACTAE